MAGPYGSVGTDYRELQAPEQVNTNLPDSGAAARAQALGSLFREFEGVAVDYGTKAATQAGAIAGAASGNTGHPQYQEGLRRFSAYGQAYNNAATGAYAVEAEAQADDAAARLRVQANNNPATFQATYSAVRDGVLKVAPPESQAMLAELYNKHLAAGMAAISGDKAAQEQQTQRQIYDEGVARATSRVANLQGSDNPNDQNAAADEHAKLTLLIRGGVNAGLYSEAEAKAMNINAMRTITAQVFQTQVDKELARPDGDVITLLDNFRKAHNANLADTNAEPILSEPEYQKLYADATTKVREYNLLVSMNKRDGKTAEEQKFETGDAQYTSLLLQGNLSERALDLGIRNGDLRPETARALRSQLLSNAGGTPTKSSPEAYTKMVSDPNFLDMSRHDIVTAQGISDSDKIKLFDEQDKRNKSWEGTQAVKQAKGTISAALKVPAGTPLASLSDSERKAVVDANQEFLSLMNATDPAKRDSMATANAQAAIQHAHERDVQEQMQNLSRDRQNAITNHGHGSADAWSDEVLNQYLKKKDDAVAALKAQLGK